MRWFKGRQDMEPVAPEALELDLDAPFQYLAQEVGWAPAYTKIMTVKTKEMSDADGIVLEIRATAKGTPDFTTFHFFFPRKFVSSLGEIVGSALAHIWMTGDRSV